MLCYSLCKQVNYKLGFCSSEPIEQWQETFDPKKEEAEIKALTDRCKVGIDRQMQVSKFRNNSFSSVD